MSKELSYADVASHSAKKDVYLVIHDKVYDASSFVDEHPGGEEVLLDVGGQDATMAFEDVGHSDEAREILDGLLIGTLKRMPGDPETKTPAPSNTRMSAPAEGTSIGIGLYAFFLMGLLASYGAYKYFENQGSRPS